MALTKSSTVQSNEEDASYSGEDIYSWKELNLCLWREQGHFSKSSSIGSDVESLLPIL